MAVSPFVRPSVWFHPSGDQVLGAPPTSLFSVKLSGPHRGLHADKGTRGDLNIVSTDPDEEFPPRVGFLFSNTRPREEKERCLWGAEGVFGAQSKPTFPFEERVCRCGLQKKKSLAHCCKSTHNFNTFNVCIFAKKSLIFYVLCNVPLLYLVILPFSLMSKSPSSQLVRWQKTFAAKIALQRRCPRQRCCVGGAGWGIGVDGDPPGAWVPTLDRRPWAGCAPLPRTLASFSRFSLPCCR